MKDKETAAKAKTNANAKPQSVEEGQAQDLGRIENHLNYNPWLRGIYDEVKAIAAIDPGAVLGDGLSAEDLYSRAEVIRNGDYEYKDGQMVLLNHEATAVPEAYFTFLFLIGGFSCRSVNLFHLGRDCLRKSEVRSDRYDPGHSVPGGVEGPSVREKVTTGVTYGGISFCDKCYPVQIILGRCDHGEYVYDRRYDSYSLIGFNRFTPFYNNCGDMLSHAMYRARENIKDKWPDGGRKRQLQD